MLISVAGYVPIGSRAPAGTPATPTLPAPIHDECKTPLAQHGQDPRARPRMSAGGQIASGSARYPRSPVAGVFSLLDGRVPIGAPTPGGSIGSATLVGTKATPHQPNTGHDRLGTAQAPTRPETPEHTPTPPRPSHGHTTGILVDTDPTGASSGAGGRSTSRREHAVPPDSRAAQALTPTPPTN